MKLKSLFPNRILVKIDPPKKERKGLHTPVNFNFLTTRGTVEKTGKDCKLKVGDKIVLAPIQCTYFNEGEDIYKVIEENKVLVKLEEE